MKNTKFKQLRSIISVIEADINYIKSEFMKLNKQCEFFDICREPEEWNRCKHPEHYDNRLHKTAGCSGHAIASCSWKYCPKIYQ